MNLGDDSQASAYVLYRDERRAGGEDLLFTGIQSTGQFTDMLSYWFEGGIVTGEDGGSFFGEAFYSFLVVLGLAEGGPGLVAVGA